MTGGLPGDQFSGLTKSRSLTSALTAAESDPQGQVPAPGCKTGSDPTDLPASRAARRHPTPPAGPHEPASPHHRRGNPAGRLRARTEISRERDHPSMRTAVKPSAGPALIEPDICPARRRESHRDQSHFVRGNAGTQSPAGAAQPAHRFPSREAWHRPLWERSTQKPDLADYQNAGDVRGRRRVVDHTPRSSSGADVRDAPVTASVRDAVPGRERLKFRACRSQGRQVRGGTDVPHTGPSRRTAMTWAREPAIGGTERCQVR